MSNYYPYLVVLIAALVTILLRFLPFMIIRGGQTPGIIVYLGKVLPSAIMGMLVIYCLRNTEITGKGHGFIELISCLSVVLLHKWKRNTLLSIIVGTAVYMILIRIF